MRARHFIVRWAAAVWVSLLVIGPAAAQDRFAAAFPKSVFDGWISQTSARQLGGDEDRRTTLMGKSIVRTYETADGERQLELMMTHSGDIYDVGEYLDLGPQADAYISESAQTVAGRLIWALLTRNEAYVRSVVASSHLMVETPFFGGKEDQVVQFVKEAPQLNVGNFYLTYEQGKPILASEVRDVSLRVYITPTLDLLTQGQSTLFRDRLVEQLKAGATEHMGSDFSPSVWYALQDHGNSYSFALPEIGYYRNARSFTRRSEGTPWASTSREQLAIPEGRIASLAALRWSTLALPDAYRFNDLNMADDFRVDMAVEGASLEKFALNGRTALDWLGNVVGRGLPAYYNTISAKTEGDQVFIRGQWMIRDPELAYEHVFRITDIFRVDDGDQYVWQRSEIRVVLAVRTDHIDQLKAKPPPATGKPPIFRVKMNR